MARMMVAENPAKTAVDALRGFPASIIGDELGRTSLLDSALVPRSQRVSFAGPIKTASCVTGDISAVMHLLDAAEAGDVLVIDARGHCETAIWGEIMQTTAEMIGVAGVVIDGAVRDTDFLDGSTVPIVSRAVSPRGPQARGSGSVGATISCGGLAISPDDIAVGDGDGIVIIRPDQLEGLATRCAQRVADEQTIITRIKQGERPRAIFGVAPLT